MKLESQVCSLELAKRLRELGVKQESAFYWDSITGNRKAKSLWKIGDVISFSYEETYDKPNDDSYAAFSVAELGKMLPAGYVTGRGWNPESAKRYCCNWYRVNADGDPEDFGAKHRAPYRGIFFAHTEADARAKMLIHLIENKLVKPEAGGG